MSRTAVFPENLEIHHDIFSCAVTVPTNSHHTHLPITTESKCKEQTGKLGLRTLLEVSDQFLAIESYELNTEINRASFYFLLLILEIIETVFLFT